MRGNCSRKCALRLEIFFRKQKIDEPKMDWISQVKNERTKQYKDFVKNTKVKDKIGKKNVNTQV